MCPAGIMRLSAVWAVRMERQLEVNGGTCFPAACSRLKHTQPTLQCFKKPGSGRVLHRGTTFLWSCFREMFFKMSPHISLLFHMTLEKEIQQF